MEKNILSEVTFTFTDPIRFDKFVRIGPIRGRSGLEYSYPLTDNELKQVIKGQNIKRFDELISVGIEQRQFPDYHSVDFAHYQMEQASLLLLAKIRCEKAEKVVIRIGNLCIAKIWAGSELIFHEKVHLNDGKFILYDLPCGETLFTCEVTCYNDEYDTDRPITFSMRLNRYQPVQDRANHQYFFHEYIEDSVYGCCNFMQEDWNQSNKDFYVFSIIPRDYLHLDLNQKVKIEVFDQRNNLRWNDHVNFKQVSSLALSPWKHDPICSSMKLVATFRTDSGQKSMERWIQAGDFLQHVYRLENEYSELENVAAIPVEFRINIVGRLKELKDLNIKYTRNRPIKKINMDMFMQYYYEIQEMLLYVQQNKSFMEYLVEKGTLTVFYKSKIDGKEEIYTISLPRKIRANQKYPIIFFSSMRRYSWYSQYLHEHDEDRSVIFVDITARGYTLGSYVGEVSLLEAIYTVLEIFPVNKSKMYFFGYTTGGFAAWSLLQNYPDLFTAGVIIGGEANLSKVENVVNIPILHFGIDSDKFRKCFAMVGRELKGNIYAEYTRVYFEEADDNTLEYLVYSPKIIDWMLKHTKPRLQPHEIYFTVDSLRHNRAYWVEVEELANAAIPAQVRVRIKNKYTLNVQADNVKSLVLHLPAELQFPLEIFINQSEYRMNKECTLIRIRNGKLEGLQQRDKLYGLPLSGTGILDIYMAPMKVYTGQQKEGLNADIIRRVVYNIANPVTIGYERQIYVDYPVYYIEDYAQIPCEEGMNYTLIQLYSSDSDIFVNCNVMLKEDGLFYKNHWMPGQYCIYTVYRHQKNGTVLLIYANDLSMMKRSVMTRSFFIPSYSSERHQFMNAGTVINIGKQYYLANDYNAELYLYSKEDSKKHETKKH